MPILESNPNREIENQLKRIADALEVLALKATDDGSHFSLELLNRATEKFSGQFKSYGIEE